MYTWPYFITVKVFLSVCLSNFFHFFCLFVYNAFLSVGCFIPFCLFVYQTFLSLCFISFLSARLSSVSNCLLFHFFCLFVYQTFLTICIISYLSVCLSNVSPVCCISFLSLCCIYFLSVYQAFLTVCCFSSLFLFGIWLFFVLFLLEKNPGRERFSIDCKSRSI
jgi:hypothetical protein